MTIPIIISLSVQAENGPTILEDATLDVEAIDLVEVDVPKSSGTVIADIQPVSSYDLDMLLIKSDNYSELYYASHIEYPATAGYHVSQSSPSTDISSLGVGAKLKIKADAETNWSEITLDASSLNTGEKIATAIEDAIQALEGVYAAVTFVYTTVYTCTSGTTGATSKIRITNGTTNDMVSSLKMGSNPNPAP